MDLKIDQRVKVSSNHWARPFEDGIIEDVKKKGRYLIRFDHKGIGFDGGKCLWLDREYLAVQTEKGG